MPKGNKARRDRSDEPKAPGRRTARAPAGSSGRKGAGSSSSGRSAPNRIAVDTGGTFTDFVRVVDGAIRIFKVPSTPASPERAILDGLGRIEAGDQAEIIHGSTVGTNALLERKGARTALVTTEGFEDVLVIGRQTRPNLYDIFTDRPDSLVPDRLRIGVRGRILSDGTVEEPLDADQLIRIAAELRRRKVESVAVSLLFSFEAPAEERAIRDALRSLGIPVSLSSEILPEYREYERTATTVVNAYLAPVMTRYLGRLERKVRSLQRSKPGPPLRVMQSNGGAVSARVAMAAPVQTILSGPAGGVVGASEIARRSGYSRAITFDMGGTSTDVALVDGRIAMTRETWVNGIPVGVPMMDIHTVGAGGGSVAHLDQGGALQVGPESAGATPGPICYGSGSQLTVTDANIILGRLQPRFFLGGEMRLVPERVDSVVRQLSWTRSWKTLQQLASGVVDVVNSNMERAVRLISVERGYDVRDFTLVCFGGAGGLHAAEMARDLGIPRVLVPPHPGALSALGLLLADVRRDYSRSILGVPPPSRRAFRSVFASLHRKGIEDLKNEGFRRGDITVADAVDARYRGQSFELTVPYSASWQDGFHRAHEQRYGYARDQAPIEVVAARSTLVGQTRKPPLDVARRRRRTRPPDERIRVWCDGKWHRVSLYDRAQLVWGQSFRGPAIVGEYSSTTWVPTGFRAEVDRFGNLVLTREMVSSQ